MELTQDATVDVVLRARADRYGYTCGPAAAGEYLAGTQRLDLTGDDAAAPVDLPFPVDIYGRRHEQAWVSTNGVISFDGPETAFWNSEVPSPGAPDNALYPFWDDLYVDEEAGVYTATVGRTFVVEWRNARFFANPADRVSVSAELHRDGTVTYRYRGLVGSSLTDGSSATIGIESPDGSDGLAYAVNTAGAVTEGLGITFRRPTDRVAATFNVTAQTEWGDRVLVVGNLPELGAWDPSRAVEASVAAYPEWTARTPLPANTRVEFKYVVRTASGTVRWEPGGNRTTVTPPTGRYVTHDTFGEQ